MALFPQPNQPGKQLNNFIRNAQLTDEADSYDGRVDWVQSASNSAFARYTYSNRNRFIPGFFGGIADGTSTSAWGRQILKGQTLSIGWTHVFGPTMINEFRFGFLRDFSFAEQDPFGKNQVDQFVPGVPENPAVAGGVSQISLTNFTFIGSPDFLPKQQVPQQFQWVDTLSKTIAKHSLKFGVDLRAPMRNIYQDEPGTRGSLRFDPLFTGLSYSDFLLGYVSSSQLTNVHFVDQRLWMLSGFVQDDWKIRRNLTLNLGLRYDFATPALEGSNEMSNFDPAANGGAGGLVTAASGSLEKRSLVQINKRNFAPRIGVAYSVTPKTVLRAGYGIYYMLFERFGSEDQLALNAPFLINNVQAIAQPCARPRRRSGNSYAVRPAMEFRFPARAALEFAGRGELCWNAFVAPQRLSRPQPAILQLRWKCSDLSSLPDFRIHRISEAGWLRKIPRARGNSRAAHAARYRSACRLHLFAQHR
jgi:hypothetical protein